MRKKLSSGWQNHFRRERQLQNYAKTQAGVKENRRTKRSLRYMDNISASSRMDLYTYSF